MANFCERLNCLVKEQTSANYGMTKEKIAKSVGISSSALSNYLSGTRTPQGGTLRMLAKYFNVSVDYLQGLSDVPSIDISIQQICKRTGLSQTALEFMQESQNTEKLRPDAPFTSPEIKVINQIVEEYATAKDPKKTALFSMMRLFDIPRQWLGNATTYITVETLLENGSKHKNGSFAEKTDAIEYLETILAHQIAERMIKLSKGDREHG